MKLVDDATPVPKCWRVLPLEKACTFHNNLRFPINLETRRQSQGEYPYYGPTGILDYLDEYRLDGTYVLIGEDGDHFLKFDDWSMTQVVSGRFNVNNHAHVLTGDNGCSSRWVFHFFCHRDLSPILTRQGAGRFKLTRAAAGKLLILIPPPEEQEAICDLLDAWDRRVTCLEQLIAAKRKYLRGLKQDLVSGRRRFPEFAGSRWEERCIASFMEESRNPGSNGEVARKLTVRLYGRGVCPKEDQRPGSSATQYHRRRAGQFIYSKLDFLNGAFGIIPAHLDGYESTLDLPAFDIAHSIDPRWFLAFVTREAFYRSHIGLANGGRKARRVNPDDFLRIRIQMPTLAEQHRIADALEAADREVGLLERQLTLLAEQKKGLMQKLLTGQVRVRIDR